MGATSAPTADDILAREYEHLRGDVLNSIRGRLRARGIALDDADLDAFSNQAWHALYDRLASASARPRPSA